MVPSTRLGRVSDGSEGMRVVKTGYLVDFSDWGYVDI
jgi:hypothetical protein